MPTINRPIKPRINTFNHKVLRKIYDSNTWKVLRNSYISQNPLCELCKQKGIIKAGEEVHHMTPFSQGVSNEHIRALAFSVGNLQTLCDECHNNIHKSKLNK